MKILRFFTMFLIGFALENGHAQVSTNWGKPLYGVQLSISLSNSVMTTGATNVLRCWINNASTNKIDIFRDAVSFSPATSFLITNDSGKSFELIPAITYSSISAIHIKPGEVYEWSALAVVGKEVSPGDYELKGVQWMYIPLNETNNPGGDLISNALKVRVRRPYWF
ncbi:MAG: hypothetical protein P4L50_21320 [Anaerolineaceae bacterium]|nr:hypothetical protein [Anaerolineaceae bacterium]